MAGKTLDLSNVFAPDNMALELARKYVSWNTSRQKKKDEWTELREYIFATDTTKTSNRTLPWKNKTTLPKLAQIRDNLYANYMKTLMPRRNWLEWEAFDRESNKKKLADNIENYMYTIVRRSNFVEAISKLVYDFIDYGNAFATVEWSDDRVELDDGEIQQGYVGPRVKRISPLDIVFNPIADSFDRTPKILQVLLTVGELKEYMDSMSTDENREHYEEIFNYVKEFRNNHRGAPNGELTHKDQLFSMDGFDTYQAYIDSDMVELLLFHGDLYDREADKLYKNHRAMVLDRHKLVHISPEASKFGTPPIYHVGWRDRQDNLWAMGPLDNLVGLQYRIDHLENLKADVFDLITFPPLKIKGYVDDFTWGPFEKIHVSEDGDVEVLSPDVNALNVNLEIRELEKKMEEMAGAPKESLGMRTPGEKTKYEVQRLENASSRVYQSKIEIFETLMEKLLGAMFEMCVRLMPPMQVSVYNEKTNITTFRELSAADITGNGQLRPVGAKHFAEKAERLQNITQFFASPVGQDPNVNVHFSGKKTAQMMEELLEIEPYELVQPFIKLSEQAEGQKLMNQQQEDVLMEQGQAAGIAPDDPTQRGLNADQARRNTQGPGSQGTPGPQQTQARPPRGQAPGGVAGGPPSGRGARPTGGAAPQRPLSGRTPQAGPVRPTGQPRR